MGSLESLFLYIASFTLAAVLMHLGLKRDQRVYIGLSLLIPILLASLRFSVGTDYNTYVSLYNNLSSLSLAEFINADSTLEITFFALAKLSAFITGDPTFFFAVSSFITMLFFYLGLKRLNIKHKALVYFLFLLIIFPLTLNLVRQGIAISICFYAFTFMIERRPWQYILWVLVAGLFHTTAFLLLPIYLFVNIVNLERQNGYLLFLIKLAGIAVLTYLLLPHAFNLLISLPFFEKYTLYETQIGEGDNYILYVQVAILAFAILFAKWVANLRNNTLYFFLLLFTTLEILFTTLGFTSAFIKRLALYFSLYNIALLTHFIDIFKDSTGKRMMYCILILYGLSYFYIAYYALGHAELFPYQTIFGAKS